MSEQKKEMDTILMFSGGVDSTYCAWDYLRKHPDKTLLLYHIDFYNWEGRAPYEKKAVEDMLAWFRANGLGNFEFIRSSMDYGDIRHINFDVISLAIFTGTALRVPKYKSIKFIITSTSLEEYNYGNPTEEYWDRHNRKEGITRLAAYREDLEWVRPITHLSKRDMLDEMPEGLSKLCWYCRRPKDGKPCGVCHTCKRVAKSKATR